MPPGQLHGATAGPQRTRRTSTQGEDVRAQSTGMKVQRLISVSEPRYRVFGQSEAVSDRIVGGENRAWPLARLGSSSFKPWSTMTS